MKGRLVFILFLLLNSFSPVFGEPLKGVGWGSTEEEAGKEALADLASSIKVQVYSKFEQTTASDRKGEVRSESSRFTRLVSNVPLINPSVTYFKDGRQVKATAVISSPDKYILKMEELSQKIDSIMTEAEDGKRSGLKYRLLESAQPLYDEYESYRIVLAVMGAENYPKPKIDAAKASATLLSMQEYPPSLEIAAEVLARPVNEPNVYVSPPKSSGSDEVTPFSSFFMELLSGKLKSVKVPEGADYSFNCSYAPSGGDLIIACSLMSGAGLAVKSSITKIPMTLVKGMAYEPFSKNVTSVIKSYKPQETDFKIALKMSGDGDPNLLREGEYFTLMVKANKPSYIYFVGYSRHGDVGSANVILLGINGAFIQPIEEKNVDKWVSLGRFRVTPPFGTETIQAFGTTVAPEPREIVPDYAEGRFGPLKVRPEVMAEDMLYLFRKIEGEKALAYITTTTIGKEK